MLSDPITFTVQHTVPARPASSPRALAVSGMFGLDFDGESEHVIVPPTTLTLAPGRVVFITGGSGGGKSTLLWLIREAIADHPGPASRPAVISLEALTPPEAKKPYNYASAHDCIQ